MGGRLELFSKGRSKGAGGKFSWAACQESRDLGTEFSLQREHDIDQLGVSAEHISWVGVAKEAGAQ